MELGWNMLEVDGHTQYMEKFRLVWPPGFHSTVVHRTRYLIEELRAL